MYALFTGFNNPWISPFRIYTVGEGTFFQRDRVSGKMAHHSTYFPIVLYKMIKSTIYLFGISTSEQFISPIISSLLTCKLLCTCFLFLLCISLKNDIRNTGHSRIYTWFEMRILGRYNSFIVYTNNTSFSPFYSLL